MSVQHSKPVSIHTPFAVKRAVSKRGYAKTFAAQPIGSGAELVSVEADLHARAPRVLNSWSCR